MLCRHCQRIEGSHGRGLCNLCHRDPEVLKLYPVLRKYYGAADTYAIGPAPIPTQALPGTEEKILVLVERVAMGQQLFHRWDAVIPR